MTSTDNKWAAAHAALAGKDQQEIARAVADLGASLHWGEHQMRHKEISVSPGPGLEPKWWTITVAVGLGPLASVATVRAPVDGIISALTGLHHRLTLLWDKDEGARSDMAVALTFGLGLPPWFRDGLRKVLVTGVLPVLDVGAAEAAGPHLDAVGIPWVPQGPGAAAPNVQMGGRLVPC